MRCGAGHYWDNISQLLHKLYRRPSHIIPTGRECTKGNSSLYKIYRNIGCVVSCRESIISKNEQIWHNWNLYLQFLLFNYYIQTVSQARLDNTKYRKLLSRYVQFWVISNQREQKQGNILNNIIGIIPFSRKRLDF